MAASLLQPVEILKRAVRPALLGDTKTGMAQRFASNVYQVGLVRPQVRLDARVVRLASFRRLLELTLHPHAHLVPLGSMNRVLALQRARNVLEAAIMIRMNHHRLMTAYFAHLANIQTQWEPTRPRPACLVP